jgi:hypothetical protein
MHRRALNRWTLWLLPLLVARLCLPNGFMLGVTSHGLGFALCPAYAPLPVPTDSDAANVQHAGMDHSAHAAGDGSSKVLAYPGSDSSDPQGRADSVCPFVLTGTAAISASADNIFEFRTPDIVTAFRAEPAWTSPAVLIDRIRGPPFA